MFCRALTGLAVISACRTLVYMGIKLPCLPSCIRHTYFKAEHSEAMTDRTYTGAKFNPGCLLPGCWDLNCFGFL